MEFFTVVGMLIALCLACGIILSGTLSIIATIALGGSLKWQEVLLTIFWIALGGGIMYSVFRHISIGLN